MAALQLVGIEQLFTSACKQSLQSFKPARRMRRKLVESNARSEQETRHAGTASAHSADPAGGGFDLSSNASPLALVVMRGFTIRLLISRPLLDATYRLMIRFFLVFLGVLAALFTFEISKFGETYFVLPFTDVLAQISAWLIKLFDSDVQSYGKIIQSTANGFAVSIERGCNGIEAVIILVAALAAFPSTWTQKLVGFAFGFVAIQALNLVRIISLFYMGQWSMIWFEWFHLYLWQALIIIDALVVWLLWLRWISRRPPVNAPAVA